MSSTDDTGRRLIDPADLVGIRTVQRMLGVGRNRAYVISQSRRFPAPVFEEERTRLWLRHEVEEYIARYRPADDEG